MMRKDKIVYSLFLMVTVALASTVAFLYINYQDSQRSFEQQSYQAISRQASRQAYIISADIEDIVSRVYNAYGEMRYDEGRFGEGSISNETRAALQRRTLIDYFPRSAFYEHADTFRDEVIVFSDLLGESTNAMYTNISDAVGYAIDRIDFVARLSSDPYRLMGELKDILGIYQRGGNMEGIANAFHEMGYYWNALSYPNYPTPGNQPSVMLEWAVGNATQMYQALHLWNESIPFG
jgi:hypothetical protein